MEGIFNLDNVESWAHLTELEEATASVFRGGDVDPIRELMDPDVTGQWEYEGSRTELSVPGQLHPRQLEALHNKARFRWLFWANQTGKTTVGAVDLVLTALGRHPNQKWEPGILLWASALTWDLWENILLPELLTWIPDGRIIDAPEPRVRSTKRVILVRADNGSVSRIVGKSAEQGAAKYQSARVHKIWMDEEHPESVYDEVQPRLLRFGGEVITTATPLLGLTWMFHRIYQPWKRAELDDHYCSHAGLADNPSIAKEAIIAISKEFDSDPAQAAARLHGQFATPSGVALQFNPTKHMETWGEGQTKTANEQNWVHLCGVDFGYWRFAMVHLLVDRAGRAHVVGEIFSQKENLTQRAKKVHDRLQRWGAPDGTRLYGDAANPTDITEINREFSRLGSPYRVRAVRAENKARQASVTLVNRLLARGALIFARRLNHTGRWRLGQSAAHDGRKTTGSRLMFEMAQWRYPRPKDGGVQAQDPDDTTADGADCIAALRYACMSHFRAAEFDVPLKPRRKNYDNTLDKLNERFKDGEDYDT